MAEECCCVPEAGAQVCELPGPIGRPSRAKAVCPECGQPGKPVQGQTVRALVDVSLRQVPEADYLFCRTQTCPVVYFAESGSPVFSVGEIRERVYQKEPEAAEVFVCYCFRHTVGAITTASAAQRQAILEDIDAGIKHRLCACDLRNPQGSCCLGNVRSKIKSLGSGEAEAPESAM